MIEQGSPDLKAAKEVADFLGTVHHEFHFTVQVCKSRCYFDFDLCSVFSCCQTTHFISAGRD